MWEFALRFKICTCYPFLLMPPQKWCLTIYHHIHFMFFPQCHLYFEKEFTNPMHGIYLSTTPPGIFQKIFIMDTFFCLYVSLIILKINVFIQIRNGKKNILFYVVKMIGSSHNLVTKALPCEVL